MAKSTAAIEIEVLPKGGADTKVKNFKQALREAKLEAQQVVIEFGAFSEEALKAQQKVANLSDQMDDFNDRIKALNPDKFAKVQTVVQGISRGFQAGQGAMALFGSQSEDLTKTLAKVQGAMALADGLEGLGKIQQQFTTLAGEIKGNVIKSFSTLKGAVSALGIGLFVAALGYVIANFEKVRKAVYNLVPGLETFSKYVFKLVQGFTDWVGITSAQDRALESLNKRTTRSNEQLEREIKLLEAQGNKLGVFAKQREKLNNELIQARANYGKNTEQEWGKIVDDTKNALQVLAVEEQNYIKEQAETKSKADKDASEKRKSQLDKEKADALERKATLLALNQSTLEDTLKASNAAFDTKVKGLKDQGYTEKEIEKLRNAEIEKVTKDFNDKQKAEQDKAAQELLANRTKFINAELELVAKQTQDQINYIKLRDKDLKDQSKTNEEIAQKELDGLNQQLAIKNKYSEDITAIETQILDKKRAIRDKDLAEEQAKADKEKAIQMAKLSAVNDSLTMISDLYTAFASANEEEQKKAFEVSKAISIAQAIMNTWQAVSSALAEKPENELFAGQRFVNAGLALAAGLVAVKKISDTQYQSKTTSGSIANSQSGQGMPQYQAPRFSNLPNQETLTQQMKVYVTEADITRTQRRVSNNQSISVVE